jgi:hypothetical protein
VNLAAAFESADRLEVWEAHVTYLADTTEEAVLFPACQIAGCSSATDAAIVSPLETEHHPFKGRILVTRETISYQE